MKIKSVLFLVVLMISTGSFLYAQNYELKYYSSILDGDYESDFSGMAVAAFLGKDFSVEDIEIIKDKFPRIGRDIDKMTRNNLWLCQKALGEWDIEEGEVYSIICVDNMYSDNVIMIFAIIDSSEIGFTWWGIVISREDAEKLNKE